MGRKEVNKMNWTDRAELDELRRAMWEMFSLIAKTPANDREIEIFVKAMDRHQEILAGDADLNG